MYSRKLKQIREKIRSRKYVMTLHAEEEMDNDGLTIFDVEHTVLTGEIMERQKDPQTKEYKFVIFGQTLSGDQSGVVIKTGSSERIVIITVYIL